MGRAVAIAEDQKTWRTYANQISASWQKGVENILDVGALLIDAKRDLKHGVFQVMVQTKLPFNASTARKLMIVARHPIIAKRSHANVLPPSWNTLYELTKVPEPRLLTAIGEEIVNPKMQRKDVKALLDVVPKAKKKAAPPPEPVLIDNPLFTNLHIIKIAECVNGLRDQLRAMVAIFTADERSELFLRLSHLIKEWERIGNEDRT